MREDAADKITEARNIIGAMIDSEDYVDIFHFMENAWYALDECLAVIARLSE